MRISNLAGAISATDNTLTVYQGEGALFPQNIAFHILIDSEIIYVYSISGDTMTLSRGHEGTAASAHDTSDDVILLVDDPHTVRLNQYVDTLGSSGADIVAQTLAWLGV